MAGIAHVIAPFCSAYLATQKIISGSQIRAICRLCARDAQCHTFSPMLVSHTTHDLINIDFLHLSATLTRSGLASVTQALPTFCTSLHADTHQSGCDRQPALVHNQSVSCSVVEVTLNMPFTSRFQEPLGLHYHLGVFLDCSTERPVICPNLPVAGHTA